MQNTYKEVLENLEKIKAQAAYIAGQLDSEDAVIQHKVGIKVRRALEALDDAYEYMDEAQS